MKCFVVKEKDRFRRLKWLQQVLLVVAVYGGIVRLLVRIPCWHCSVNGQSLPQLFVRSKFGSIVIFSFWLDTKRTLRLIRFWHSNSDSATSLNWIFWIWHLELDTWINLFSNNFYRVVIASCHQSSITQRTAVKNIPKKCHIKYLIVKLTTGCRRSKIETASRNSHCVLAPFYSDRLQKQSNQPFNVKRNLSLRNRIEKWDPLSPRMLPTTTTSIPLLIRRIGHRKVVAYEDGNLSIPTTTTKIVQRSDLHRMDCVHQSFLLHLNHWIIII